MHACIKGYVVCELFCDCRDETVAAESKEEKTESQSGGFLVSFHIRV